MRKNQIQKTVNELLSFNLRKTFLEEGTSNKNVTFSLSDEIIQKIEDISKSNKRLEDEYKVSGLPTTKTDILTNAIETYYEAYFAGLNDLGLELDEEGNIEEIVKGTEKEQQKDSPLVADTLIVPAHYGKNFEEMFLTEHQWRSVKVAEWRLKNLRYLGVYVGRPLSQITHYAPIKGFAPSEDDLKKYKFELGEPIELDNPITISKHSPTGLQRGVYTTLEHLKNSNYVDELKNWWHK